MTYHNLRAYNLTVINLALVDLFIVAAQWDAQVFICGRQTGWIFPQHN